MLLLLLDWRMFKKERTRLPFVGSALIDDICKLRGRFRDALLFVVAICDEVFVLTVLVMTS